MPEEQKPKLRLEIGHVLFLNVVGYSKLPISEQSAQLQKLKEIVRETEQIHRSAAARLPMRISRMLYPGSEREC